MKRFLGSIGGAAGGFGLLSLFGICGGVCSASALPLGALLASFGFGGLSVWLLHLRLPLLIASALFGTVALASLVRSRRALASAVVGLLLGAALAVNLRIVLSTPGTPSVPYRELNVAALAPKPDAKLKPTTLEDFRKAFNADKDSVRIVAVLSPECGGCVKGHEILKHLFATNRFPRLKGYMVWLPMMKEDSFDAARDRAWSVSDDRIKDYWDRDRNVGIAYTGTLGLNRTAWDVYAVYGPGIVWAEDKAPPAPRFWMHQLWGVPRANFLDASRLMDRVGELTKAAVM